MNSDSPTTNAQSLGLKNAATSWAQLAWVSCDTVGMKAMMEAAKITGITPAMFTRKGRYVEPPDVIRRPTTRLAYCTGIRRWPSWMKTIARITASAMKGIITTKTWSGLFHQAEIPAGSRLTIDA